MNNELAKLEKKYGDLEFDTPVTLPEPDPPVTINHRKESESVFMLFCFLKEYGEHGFFLQQTTDGHPVLHLSPPLKNQDLDRERWELAEHAAYLFYEAKLDLIHLISNGTLVLEEREPY